MKKKTQRVSAAVWAKMSQEARDQLRQKDKESQGRQRGGHAFTEVAAAEAAQ